MSLNCCLSYAEPRADCFLWPYRFAPVLATLYERRERTTEGSGDQERHSSSPRYRLQASHTAEWQPCWALRHEKGESRVDAHRHRHRHRHRHGIEKDLVFSPCATQSGIFSIGTRFLCLNIRANCLPCPQDQCRGNDRRAPNICSLTYVAV